MKRKIEERQAEREGSRVEDREGWKMVPWSLLSEEHNVLLAPKTFWADHDARMLFSLPVCQLITVEKAKCKWLFPCPCFPAQADATEGKGPLVRQKKTRRSDGNDGKVGRAGKGQWHPLEDAPLCLFVVVR